MRECPKCHYLDAPNWRPPRWQPDLDYCRFDEFQDILPDLAIKLLPGKTVEDELYVYRRSKTGKFVYRVWGVIFRAWGHGKWSDFRKTKMYDTAGRLRKDSWERLQKVVAQDEKYRRKHKGDLELYLDKVVT